MTHKNKIYQGDSLEVLKTFGDCTIDSVVTDPPAGISFRNEDFDNPRGYNSGEDSKTDRDRFVSYIRNIMVEVLRVLKPGGYMICWAIPRTVHWTAWAIEEAGFELRNGIYNNYSRDTYFKEFVNSLDEEQKKLFAKLEVSDSFYQHIFGSGFPKGVNIGKAYDKKYGNKRKIIKEGSGPARQRSQRCVAPSSKGINSAEFNSKLGEVTEPASDFAKKWEGWNTNLKPAVEVWIMARKPLEEKTVLEQVEKTGTGAINIDGCRTGNSEGVAVGVVRHSDKDRVEGFLSAPARETVTTFNPHVKGRWPANVVFEHDSRCVQTGLRQIRTPLINAFTGGAKPFGGAVGENYETSGGEIQEVMGYDCVPTCPIKLLEEQEVTSSNYFNTVEFREPFVYAVKASVSDKNLGGVDNTHPTVKSQALMEHLVKLVTPPGGIVLDCFAGSGSTLLAAMTLGFQCVGIEKEAKFYKIAKERIENYEAHLADKNELRDNFSKAMQDDD